MSDNKRPLFRGKIDVTRIDKSLLFKGKQGTYLDFVVFECGQDWADYTIAQQVTKEQREQGVKGPIIGNMDDFPEAPAVRQPQHKTVSRQETAMPAGDDDDDSVPF